MIKISKKCYFFIVLKIKSCREKTERITESGVFVHKLQDNYFRTLREMSTHSICV